MAQTLRDFIASRRAELDNLEAPLRDEFERIRKELAEIQSERDELDAAENAIGGAVENASVVTKRVVPDMTIKDAVIKVLREEPRGLAAMEILRRINSELGTDYARTSLSPQLSRLKQDGRIDLHGQIWRLTGLEGMVAAFGKIAKDFAETRDPATTSSSGEGATSNEPTLKWGDI